MPRIVGQTKNAPKPISAGRMNRTAILRSPSSLRFLTGAAAPVEAVALVTLMSVLHSSVGGSVSWQSLLRGRRRGGPDARCDAARDGAGADDVGVVGEHRRDLYPGFGQCATGQRHAAVPPARELAGARIAVGWRDGNQQVVGRWVQAGQAD